jgi:hypothetical protein
MPRQKRCKIGRFLKKKSRFQPESEVIVTKVVVEVNMSAGNF